MISIRYIEGNYVCFCEYEERGIPALYGFKWHAKYKVWFTQDQKVAKELIEYADDTARQQLLKRDPVADSWAEDSDLEIPCNPGLEYLPYQKAGIEYALRAMGFIE